MTVLSRVTWLFVRGDESVRVSQLDPGLAITADGPGHSERVFTFGDEPTADEFLRLYEQDLLDDGWVLQAFVDRRCTPGPVPLGGDRRRGAGVH